MQTRFLAVGHSLRSVSMPIIAAALALVVSLPQSSSAQTPEQMTVDQTPIRTLTAEQVDMHKSRIASGFIGVGLSVRPVLLAGDGVRVTRVETDSPAQAAGLKVGDEIVAVAQAQVAGSWGSMSVIASDAGEPIRYWSLYEVHQAIQGPSQSMVTLTIVRGGYAQRITVKRDLDQSIGVTIELVNPLLAYQVTSVPSGSEAQAAGIVTDDIITKVDGYGTQSLSRDDVTYRIDHGSIGSTVSLTVLPVSVEAGKQFGSGFQRNHQQPTQVTIARSIVQDWELSYGSESRSGGDRSNLEYNRSVITIKNLDWDGLVQRVDDEIDGMNKLPGAILDLRGASGDNPEIAALVAAHFLPGESKLMLVRERLAEDRFIDLYHTTDGTTYRTRYISDSIGRAIGPASHDALKAIGTVDKHYNGKLVVLVDDYTAGTAEALAYTLQHTGRAEVVGFKTAGESTISTFFETGDGATMIKAATGKLLTLQGKPVRVVPDHSVFFRQNLFEAARNELAGKRWYNDGNTIVVLALILMVLAVVARCAIRARKSAANKVVITDPSGSLDSWIEQRPHEFGGYEDMADQATPQRISSAGANSVDAIDAVLDDGKASVKNKPNRRSWWLLALTLAGFLGGFIGLPLLCQYLFMGAPHGTSARLAVTLFVDGSELSFDQKQVVDQLASEYSGAIAFQTIDIRQHPDVTTGNTPVTSTPETRIAMQWYRKDGTKVRDEWQGMTGPATKREIVEIIGYMSHSSQRFWPSAVIHRTKNTGR